MKRNPLFAMRVYLPVLMVLGLVWATGASPGYATSAMNPTPVPEVQAPGTGPGRVSLASPPGDPLGWVLTFSDEFTGTSLDRSKWATKMPYSLSWWSTGKSDRTTDSQEAEWYVDDAQTFNNGVLSLTVKKGCIAPGRPEIDPTIYNSANFCNGNYTSACTDNGPYSCTNFPYTSGMIASYPSFSQKYGYFEASMKLPAGTGLWPAFWLMPMPSPQPSSTPWPWTSVFWPPEIDIMENIGQPTSVNFTSHYNDTYPVPGSVANTWNHGLFHMGSYSGPDFSTGFHTFGLDWEPTGITWYVDGVARYNTTQNLPPGSLSPGNMYVIFSMAVGGPGSFPGVPDASTVFPQSLDIQYVRVYQKVTNGTPPPPTATPTGTLTPPPGGEVVDPANIATLPANTNVLLDFNNYPVNVDGQPLPANYAGCTWNSLVEGAPWAGISTWGFYITGGGPQATITFPRPVIVQSMRVASTGSNNYTLSSAGNPDVSLTTLSNTPQTLVTGWTNAVTSLTVHSSTGDQAFDDLRFTTQSTGTPTNTPTSLPTSTLTRTPTNTPSNTPPPPTPVPTKTPKPKPTHHP